MQIMIINPRWSNPKSYDVSTAQLFFLAGVLFLISAIFAVGLYLLTLNYAATIPVPFLRETFMNVAVADQKRQDEFVRENIKVMAVQLGEVKAQMLKLEALGDRVSGLAGLKKEFNFKEIPGRGGLEHESHNLTLAQLLTDLERTNRLLANRSDLFDILENELLDKTLKSRQIPTASPVSGVMGSGYGIRFDPFTGNQAFHKGMDFAAPTGTAIFAAAGGIVITYETNNVGYGNMLEIDHGNNLITRYAHLSKSNVKIGDIIKMGQQVAEVGSTGRSTGPHLHFEVLVNGEQQNPAKFLAAGNRSTVNTAQR